MKWVLLFLFTSVLAAGQRPLHVSVSQLEKHFSCEVDYPESLRNRASSFDSTMSLDDSLKKLFTREDYVIEIRDGKTKVRVIMPSPKLPKNQANPVKTRVGEKEVAVDADSLLLRFDAAMSEASRASLLDKVGVKYNPDHLGKPFTLVRVPAAKREALVSEFKRNAKVEVGHNYLVKASGPMIKTAGVKVQTASVEVAATEIGDAYFEQQWGYSAVKAHVGYGVDLQKRKIAVLDTGVNLSHPDLQNADIVSMNAEGQETTEDNDTVGHGSAVVGLIAAEWNNQGIAGMSSAQVLSINVFE